jgi:hypothetical protein
MAPAEDEMAPADATMAPVDSWVSSQIPGGPSEADEGEGSMRGHSLDRRDSTLNIFGDFAEFSADEVERRAAIAEDLRAKFGEVSRLTPWFPPELIDWDGQWLVRMVAPPMATLLADGVKKCEIMPLSDWISWGVQGIIVTAIYQGVSALANTSEYVPKRFRAYASKQEDKGKIVAVAILGPPDSPNRAEDKGWYSPTSPMGAKASMHRVLAYYKLPVAYEPVVKYGLRGGFTILSTQDIKGICATMAKSIIEEPKAMLFTRPGQAFATPTSIWGDVPSVTVVEEWLEVFMHSERANPRIVRSVYYPAQQELYPELGNTPSPYRVKRKVVKGSDMHRELSTVMFKKHINSQDHVWVGTWSKEGVVTPIDLSEHGSTNSWLSL